jgi:hypothetical protein
MRKSAGFIIGLPTAIAFDVAAGRRGSGDRVVGCLGGLVLLVPLVLAMMSTLTAA